MTASVTLGLALRLPRGWRFGFAGVGLTTTIVAHLLWQPVGSPPLPAGARIGSLFVGEDDLHTVSGLEDRLPLEWRLNTPASRLAQLSSGPAGRHIRPLVLVPSERRSRPRRLLHHVAKQPRP